MKLYLAGPMRGLPESNFPAFDAATARLRFQLHEVFSPAERDRQDGVNCHNRDIAYFMGVDLPEVCKADAVAVLPGWKQSQGCTIELAVADALGKPILDAETLQPIKTGVFIATMEV